MSKKISSDWIEFVGAVVNSEDDYSIFYGNLPGSGGSGDPWKLCHCPLHDDQNKSFVFNSQTGDFKCLSGCGDGDVYAYMMVRLLQEGKAYADELRRLASEIGVDSPI